MDVDSGTLALANNGSSSNSTFMVVAGSTLDITGGQGPTWAGLMSGSGAGQVLFDGGTLNANNAVLNFTPGLFQWTGGQLNGSLVNSNLLTISGQWLGESWTAILLSPMPRP